MYELREAEDKPFIVMEYVGGITLKERMRQGQIEEEEIRTWLKFYIQSQGFMQQYEDLENIDEAIREGD